MSIDFTCLEESDSNLNTIADPRDDLSGMDVARKV